MSGSVPPPPPRLALTIQEAAEAVGLSENAFRDHLYAACPKFYAGRSVRIPIQAFGAYILDLARAQEVKGEELLAGLVDDFI